MSEQRLPTVFLTGVSPFCRDGLSEKDARWFFKQVLRPLCVCDGKHILCYTCLHPNSNPSRVAFISCTCKVCLSMLCGLSRRLIMLLYSCACCL